MGCAEQKTKRKEVQGKNTEIQYHRIANGYVGKLNFYCKSMNRMCVTRTEHI